VTTSVILNILFAVLIVGGLAAVCRTAYVVTGGKFDVRPRSFDVIEGLEEEQRLAA